MMSGRNVPASRAPRIRLERAVSAGGCRLSRACGVPGVHEFEIHLHPRSSHFSMRSPRARPCGQPNAGGCEEVVGVRFNFVESQGIQNPESRIQEVAQQRFACFSTRLGFCFNCVDTNRGAFVSERWRNSSEFCILAPEFWVRIHYCGSHPGC